MSENPESPPPPTVFISYSHDDKDHKAWVTKLATRLRDKGVDVILDQWDTEPGDDLAKFMESGVRDSDRVLMVCTEKYVRKVDDGKGGAGYEAMIVSSELIADQGMRKFVPIVRQTSEKRTIPTALCTRKYIDLSDDVENPDEQFDELVESIHKVTPRKKPPLGPNPYGEQHVETTLDVANVQSEKAALDPLAGFDQAIEVIRSQDRLSWRRMQTETLTNCQNRLLTWKSEQQPNCPSGLNERDPKAWLEYFGAGIEQYDQFLALMLAAAEAGDPEYSGQTGWIDLVIQPKGWERSGYTIWTDLPRAVLYTLQAYMGAMLMRTGFADLAVKLATTPIPSSTRQSEMSPLYLTQGVSGWIETFGHNCVVSWAYFGVVGDKREWLLKIFGSEENIRSGRVAYYMLLSFLEFVKDAAKEEWIFNPKDSHFEVSHMFVREPFEIQRSAFALLAENKDTLLKVMKSSNLGEERFRELWPQWVSGMNKWVTLLRDGWLHDHGNTPLISLPQELYRNPFDLRE